MQEHTNIRKLGDHKSPGRAEGYCMAQVAMEEEEGPGYEAYLGHEDWADWTVEENEGGEAPNYLREES